MTTEPLAPETSHRCRKSQYHHTPCSAALDFARTTTPEPLITRKVHKLAQPIIEYYAHQSPASKSRDQPLRRGIVKQSFGGYAHFSSPKHGEQRRQAATDRPDWTEQDECSKSPSSVFGPSLKTGSARDGASRHVERAIARDNDPLTMKISRPSRKFAGCTCFT